MAARPKKRSAPPSRTPLLERIASALGMLLVLAMMGVIGWQAITESDDMPPAITVGIERIVAVPGGWVVEFQASNSSRATAADVEVEGTLKRGRTDVATSRTSLAYVAGGSREKGGLLFAEDPRSGTLLLRALGYEEP